MLIHALTKSQRVHNGATSKHYTMLFRVHLNSTIQRKDQPLIVFGIPTVSRSKTEYLNQTMKSLLSHLSPQEKSECLFVIMVAEIIQNKAIDLVKRINKTYR